MPRVRSSNSESGYEDLSSLASSVPPGSLLSQMHGVRDPGDELEMTASTAGVVPDGMFFWGGGGRGEWGGGSEGMDLHSRRKRLRQGLLAMVSDVCVISCFVSSYQRYLLVSALLTLRGFVLCNVVVTSGVKPNPTPFGDCLLGKEFWIYVVE